MKRGIFVAILFVLTFAHCLAAETNKPPNVYIATDGDDSAPGTIGRPLAKLEGARDAIRRMQLARWPNEGFVHLSKVVDPGPMSEDADFRDRGGVFTYDFDRPSLWTQAEDAWLDGVFSKDWIWSYNKIAAVDPEAKTITLRYGETSGLLNWRQDFFYAENLLEELDAPGEYFVDRTRGLLFFIPPDSFDRIGLSGPVGPYGKTVVARWRHPDTPKTG